MHDNNSKTLSGTSFRGSQSMEASPLSDFFQPNHTGLGGSSFSTYAKFSEKLAFIKKKE